MQSLKKSIGLIRFQASRVPLSHKRIQIRLQHNQNTDQGSAKSGFYRNAIIYTASIAVGAGLGISCGNYLFKDEPKTTHDPIKSKFLKRKLVEHTNSKYADFPYEIVLYQYFSCPYCLQIRKYLDYFGFNYHLVEVDSYSKKSLSKFTLARVLPILVLKDKASHSEWHLTNATAIMSAMESIRNEDYENCDQVLTKYLPTLVGNRLLYSVNPYKYYVSKSDLNSVEWRRWINNRAVPAFRLVSISNFKNLFETFDYYSQQSDWEIRYNLFKYYLVYYYNAFWTYTRYNELLNKFDTKKKPSQILNEVVSEWENGLQKNKFMSGNDRPNLADLAMFSTAYSFEGITFFRKLLDKHPKFQTWYERMKTETEKGPEQIVTADRRKDEILPLEAATVEELTQTNNNDIIEEKESQINNSAMTQKKSIKDSLSALRILSITYLVHVLAFTFASCASK